MLEVYQSTVSPAVGRITVDAGDTGKDMTTAISVLFKVQGPDGLEATWSPCSIDRGQTTATVLVVDILFPGAPGYVPVVGDYSAVAVVTFSDGDYRSTPLLVAVRPYYGDPL